MTKAIAIAAAILVAAAISALAQGGAPQGAQHPTDIGHTGTMYDGNNADLQLPSEQNAYWVQLWAEPSASANAGLGSAVGAGAAGISRGGPQTSGQH
jgi:hypothetical protein